jgi:hypothetical protein
LTLPTSVPAAAVESMVILNVCTPAVSVMPVLTTVRQLCHPPVAGKVRAPERFVPSIER